MVQIAPSGAPGHRILWFHPRPLLPARGGGELRVTGLISTVVAHGHEVLVVHPGPLESLQPLEFPILEARTRGGLSLALAKIFSSSPLRTARLTRAGISAMREAIRNFDPDLAVVSELLSWPVAAPLLPPVPWILDAHNVESRLFADMAAGSSTVFARFTLAIDRARVARQEASVVARADAVLAVSANDAKILATLRPGRSAPLVVPSSVPMPPQPVHALKTPVVLFVGTLDYPPNTAAVEELVRHVMPRVRAFVPNSRVIIAGRRAPAVLRKELAQLNWADLREDLPDLNGVYGEARCAVLPIRSGGGSRLKVYEALAYGVPIVGTPRAISGVDICGDVAVVAETADALADATVRVLQDDDLAGRLAQSSRSWFVENLSWEHAAAPLLKLIDELA